MKKNNAENISSKDLKYWGPLFEKNYYQSAKDRKLKNGSDGFLRLVFPLIEKFFDENLTNIQQEVINVLLGASLLGKKITAIEITQRLGYYLSHTNAAISSLVKKKAISGDYGLVPILKDWLNYRKVNQ